LGKPKKKQKLKEIAEKFNATGVAVAWRSAEKLHAQYVKRKDNFLFGFQYCCFPGRAVFDRPWYQ
jgi:hypothetical protein